MKKHQITLILLLTCFLVQSKEIIVSSKLEKVKLYLGGAQIFRNFELPPIKGTHTIIIGGLSGSLFENTFHFSSLPNVKILSYYKQRVVNIKKLESTPESDSLLKYDQKLKGFASELRGIDQESDLLTANIGRISNSSQVLNIQDLSTFSTFYRNRTKEISDRQDFLKEQIKICNDYIQAIKKGGNFENSKIDESICNMVLLVEKFDEEKGTLECSYFTPDAGWLPEYDMNCKIKENKIDFSYKAKILNNSGEEWKNAQLTLTTNDPVYYLEKPDPEAWGLTFGRNKRKGYSFTRTESGSEGNVSNYVLKVANYNNANSNDFTEIDVPEITKEFVIPRKYSVPTQKNPFIIDVYKKELLVTFYFFAMPKVSKDVFLISKIGNWEELDLIDGSVNLFNGETYIGLSKIQPSISGDTMEVVVGVDDKVSVNKAKRKDLEGSGFLGLNKKESFKYDIFVKNSHSVLINLELVDQVPISQEKEIEINVNNITNAMKEDSNGKLVWRLTLPPNQTQKVSVEFDVRYPGNRIVNIRTNRGAVRCPKFR